MRYSTTPFAKSNLAYVRKFNGFTLDHAVDGLPASDGGKVPIPLPATVALRAMQDALTVFGKQTFKTVPAAVISCEVAGAQDGSWVLRMEFICQRRFAKKLVATQPLDAQWEMVGPR